MKNSNSEKNNNTPQLTFEKQRAILDSVGEAVIVINPQHRIFFWNKTAELMYGWKAKEVIGKNIIELLFAKANKDKIQTCFERLKKQTPWMGQFLVNHKNKIPFIAHFTFTPLFDENEKLWGVTGISYDMTKTNQKQQEIISAKRRAEKAADEMELLLEKIHKQKQKIEALLSGAEHVLKFDDFETTARQLFDFCKIITGAKAGYVALLSDNGDENEVLFLDSGGDDCTVDPELPMPIRGLREVAYRTGEAVYDNDFANSKWMEFMPEGHVYMKNVMFAPLTVQKKIVGLVGLANKAGDFNDDDAGIVSAFAELASIALKNSRNLDELRIARDKAEMSDKLKTAFLANMSHEIRTPLNGIMGFAEMLRKPDLSQKKRNHFVELISKSSHELLSIINDIIDISKIEAGETEIREDIVNLNYFMLDIYHFFKSTAAMSNLDFYLIRGLNDNQSIIKADTAKLQQIINNLISNALKFTHEGSIEFGYHRRDDFLEFFVHDSGIGIAPELDKVVFERFRQADMSITRKYGGTGLGLSISKAFTELLGGKIWYKSSNKGTTFYFTIPYRRAEMAKLGPQIPQRGLRQWQNKTILVAEDKETNFLYIEEALTDTGIRIIHAKNGKEAVELFLDNPSIDIILMDIKMPEMSGYEAIKQIREDNPAIPVIALTAYAMQEDEDTALKAGCQDYLAKPVGEQVLLDTLAKYL